MLASTLCAAIAAIPLGIVLGGERIPQMYALLLVIFTIAVAANAALARMQKESS